VEDGHPCYVDADWQGRYFLVTPTKPWALSVKDLTAPFVVWPVELILLWKLNQFL